MFMDIILGIESAFCSLVFRVNLLAAAQTEESSS
jgi:hypothetical protein